MPLPCIVFERVGQILFGVLGEVVDAHVAGLRIDHEVRGDGRNGDLVAHHVHRNQIVEALAANADRDERALRPLEPAHRLIAGPALGVLAFDARDHVAAANALAVRGRAFEDAHDGDVAVDGDDGEAEAVVAAFLPLAHLRVGPRIHEARMRIERLQHAVDGAVDQAIGFDGVGVVGLDRAQRRRERLVVIGQPIFGGQRAASEHAAGEGRQQNGEGGGRQGPIAAHDRMLTE